MTARVSYEQRRGCGFRKVGGTYLVAKGPSRSCCRLPFELDVCPACGTGVKPTRGWTWIDVGRLLATPVATTTAKGVATSVATAKRVVDAAVKFVELATQTPDLIAADPHGHGDLELGRRLHATSADLAFAVKEHVSPSGYPVGDERGEVRDCGECPMADPVTLGRVGLLWIGEQFYPTVEDFQREASKMGISRRVASVPKGFVLGKTWVLLAHRKAISTPDGPRPGVFRLFRPEAIERIVPEDVSPDEVASLKARGIDAVIVRPVTDPALFQDEGEAS